MKAHSRIAARFTGLDGLLDPSGAVRLNSHACGACGASTNTRPSTSACPTSAGGPVCRTLPLRGVGRSLGAAIASDGSRERPILQTLLRGAHCAHFPGECSRVHLHGTHGVVIQRLHRNLGAQVLGQDPHVPVCVLRACLIKRGRVMLIV